MCKDCGRRKAGCWRVGKKVCVAVHRELELCNVVVSLCEVTRNGKKLDR